MILAAGRGERMRPLTDHTPKPLLTVGGKALIVWHLERLAMAGFKEIVINHAHLGHKIESQLGNGHNWGLSIAYSTEGTALETAGGIARALPLLQDSSLPDQPFLVVNGDIFTDIDFAKLKHAPAADKLAHLLLVDNPPQHAAGDFCLDGQQLTLAGACKLTFSGVAIYRPQLFAHVAVGKPVKLAPILQDLIARDLVSGEHHQGIWHDIGTPKRLCALDTELKRQLKIAH